MFPSELKLGILADLFSSPLVHAMRRAIVQECREFESEKISGLGTGEDLFGAGQVPD
jgi:hypothetical protein